MAAKAKRPPNLPLPRRLADFATLGDALDYAAQGVRGLNFHDARGVPFTRATWLP